MDEKNSAKLFSHEIKISKLEQKINFKKDLNLEFKCVVGIYIIFIDEVIYMPTIFI